jgi:hypothetical protein
MEAGMKMKMYMGYSEAMGSCEGAVLIFANTAKEAMRIFRKADPLDIGEFTDFRVSWIKDKPFLEKEKLHDYPHIVECPKLCSKCDMWGVSKIGEDGICDSCREAANESR